jgi:hypothetical protein
VLSFFATHFHLVCRNGTLTKGTDAGCTVTAVTAHYCFLVAVLLLTLDSAQTNSVLTSKASKGFPPTGRGATALVWACYGLAGVLVGLSWIFGGDGM